MLSQIEKPKQPSQPEQKKSPMEEMIRINALALENSKYQSLSQKEQSQFERFVFGIVKLEAQEAIDALRKASDPKLVALFDEISQPATTENHEGNLIGEEEILTPEQAKVVKFELRGKITDIISKYLNPETYMYNSSVVKVVDGIRQKLLDNKTLSYDLILESLEESMTNTDVSAETREVAQQLLLEYAGNPSYLYDLTATECFELIEADGVSSGIDNYATKKQPIIDALYEDEDEA